MKDLVSVYIARWHKEIVDIIVDALEKEGLETFVIGHLRDTHVAVHKQFMLKAFQIVEKIISFELADFG